MSRSFFVKRYVAKATWILLQGPGDDCGDEDDDDDCDDEDDDDDGDDEDDDNYDDKR